MKKMHVVSCLVAGFAFLVVMAAAHADVIITLKSGKTHTVKVDKDDIESITFEDGKPERFGRRGRPDRDEEPSITWDFETGRLDGWAATGTAFNNQPTYGDNPTARNRGQASNHQGDFWIGGYENRHTRNDNPGDIQGDGPKGTLTSQTFTITKRNIGFLIGGGCDMNTIRAELVINDTVYRQCTGKCTETMSMEKWDVSDLIGKKAQIRLIDKASGGWGHINFDDVRFY